ncbi:cytochrome C [Dyella dinghuensis]|jgi:cytochrome c556|uniref:Cytochrome C n=1 Tax=Dyella dinghuensis TaxID=1920169 RepID=A0A3S0PI18_9GAMM|nr:cytochrome c [Dyella dinghuensis]RUL67207.1 cytochrome C [Dyella dinghuensis]
MRAALLIVLGLAIGIIGTVFVMNALEDRNPLPHAMMVTMSFHRHQLQQEIKGQHCDASATVEQLQSMQMLSKDIPAAFPDAPQPFLDLAHQLHSAVQTAAQSAPADCPALVAALKPVDKVCGDCHKQYR